MAAATAALELEEALVRAVEFRRGPDFVLYYKPPHGAEPGRRLPRLHFNETTRSRICAAQLHRGAIFALSGPVFGLVCERGA